MKKIKWLILCIFITVCTVLVYMNEKITLQPWITEIPLEWISHASGNEDAIAVIVDSAKTIVVINNEGELLYKIQAGLFPGRSFVNAGHVELDLENNLYVYDKIFGGVNEENTERILKYSSSGKFLGVVYSHSYINEDFIIYKGKINSIAIDGDTLHIIRLEHDGFYLESVKKDEFVSDNTEISSTVFFEFPNAYRRLSNCRLNVINRRIVWTVQGGNILQYDFSGSFINEIVFDDDTTPYSALSDNNNNIIYSDIWNCEIGLINDQTGEKSIIFHRPMSEGMFYYYINHRNNKTYASYNAEDLLIIDDGTFINIASFSFSINDIIIRYVLFVLCIINAILLLFLVYKAVFFLLKRKTSVLFRQIFIFGICVILGASIAALIILQEMQKQSTSRTFNDLENISRLIATSIDVDFINSLHSPKQFDGEEYRVFSDNLSFLFSELQFQGIQVGAIIWIERDGIIYTIYDLEYAHHAFHPWGDYEESYVEEIFTSGEYSQFLEYLPSGIWEYVMGPIFDKDNNIVASIEIDLNVQKMREANRNMILQTALIVLATTVAFLLLLIECLMMFDAYIKNKNDITGNKTTQLNQGFLKLIIALLINAYKKPVEKSVKYAKQAINYLSAEYKSNLKVSFYPELLRAAAFFMYFSANFASALLPMYAAELYVPVFNLPREFIITLPFVALSGFIVISLIIIPSFIKKTGVKKICFIAAILFVVGNVNCIIAGNVIHLSAGYALIGLSLGTFSLIFNTIIGSQDNAEKMNEGFAHLNASYLAGVNVGVVFGAIIAQFFSYRTIFWFSSSIALLFMAFILFSLRSKLFEHFYNKGTVNVRLRMISLDSQLVERNKSAGFSLLKFLFKPVVICILLMAFVPYVITINFVEYFMPVFAIENGLGEANIGQLMLLSGLFAILFAANLCRLMAKKVPILITVLFPLLLNAAAMYLFSIYVSIGMLIVTIILIAVVNIFASTNIQTYFSLLYQQSGISSVKALGAYQIVENIAMAAGPIVFSYILVNDISTGMKMLALVILGCAIIFAVVSLFSVKWNNKTLDKITK